MSKQISAMNLAHVFCRLLLNAAKEFDTTEQADAFANAAAQLITEHCGGRVNGQSEVEGHSYISIVADDSLPDDGGIWSDYDVEGDLFNREHFFPTMDQVTAFLKQDTFVVCRNGAQDIASFIDTVWQVDFTNYIETEFDDYLNCLEWQYLMNEASFTHTEASDLLVHVECLVGETKAPPVIREIAHEAHNMGMTWILFHLGQ